MAEDLCVGVARVELEEELAAGAAGWEESVCADGDELEDVAFAVGEHGADGVAFGAEAEGAGGVEADAGVDASGGGEERGGDAAEARRCLTTALSLDASLDFARAALEELEASEKND